MTGLVRKVTLIAVIGLLAAATAMAGVPSPTNSTFTGAPTVGYVDLVSCNGTGVVNPRGVFTLVVRDGGNIPIPNCTVSVCFNNDVRSYDAIAGYTVNCGSGNGDCVSAVTDATGLVTFNIPGGGKNATGAATFLGTGACTIWACNTIMGTYNVAVFDQNGAVGGPGMSILDVSAFVSDYNKRGLGNRPRSDFTHSGALDILDLSSLVTVYNSAYKVACGTMCP